MRHFHHEQSRVKQYGTSGFNCGPSALSSLSTLSETHTEFLLLVLAQQHFLQSSPKTKVAGTERGFHWLTPYIVCVYARCRWVDLQEFRM